MKKLIMLLLAVCLMAPMATADTNKQLEKALNKEKKEKMKEYKKRAGSSLQAHALSKWLF